MAVNGHKRFQSQFFIFLSLYCMPDLFYFRLADLIFFQIKIKVSNMSFKQRFDFANNTLVTVHPSSSHDTCKQKQT